MLAVPAAAAGLDDVGVERALHEELDLSALLAGLADDLARGLLEHADELASDDLALLLRVGDPGERVEEPVGGVDDLRAGRRWRRRSRARPARASPLRSRPWSTKTQVQLVADRRCTSAAATAESTPPDRPQIARLSPTCARIALDLLVDDVDHRPGRPAAGDVVEEVLEHLLPVLGVQDLGVELHAGEAARRRPRTPRPGAPSVEASTAKPVGRLRHRVAVRHPDRAASAGMPVEQRARLGDPQRVRPNSDAPGLGDLAAEARAIAWKP